MTARASALRRFHLAAIAAFGAVETVALLAHYLGPSPYGGPLNPDAHRYLPEAIAAHLAVIVAFVLGFALLARLAAPRLQGGLSAACAGVTALLVGFNQFDLEVVRWMGEHVNLSYLSTHADVGDLQVLRRALVTDPGCSLLAAVWVAGAGDRKSVV